MFDYLVGSKEDENKHDTLMALKRAHGVLSSKMLSDLTNDQAFHGKGRLGAIGSIARVHNSLVDDWDVINDPLEEGVTVGWERLEKK